MQSNVTLKLDDALLKEARKLAVEENTSLSAWMAGLIVQNMRKRGDRQAARHTALCFLEKGFDLAPGRPSRESLHERR